MTLNKTLKDNNDFKTTLYRGSLTELQEMLDHGMMPDLPDPDMHNNTPVHLAAYNKWPDKLQVLLASLKDEPGRLKKVLEAINVNDVTPLFEAIWVGRPPHVFEKETKPSREVLLKYTENFNKCMENMPQTVRILLEAGADIDSKQKGYPGGKKEGSRAYTTMEWLNEQLRYQNLNSPEANPIVRKALEESLKVIKEYKQKKISRRRNNQNT